jgi:hypothetical protein
MHLAGGGRSAKGGKRAKLLIINPLLNGSIYIRSIVPQPYVILVG